MHNQHEGSLSFPMTKTFTNGNSDLRNSTQQIGEGQLATEDLRLLVAAMID